ncbi:MAG: FecR domain-containing protein [Candidatus Riflebacteria bacterium]
MKKCPETKNLFENMIGRDNPIHGPEDELRHLESCNSCQKMKAKITLLESALSSYPSEVNKHISANPILLKDISRPAANKSRPLQITILAFFLIAVTFWFYINSKPEKGKISQPVQNEKATPKSLPGNFIVDAEKNLKTVDSFSFSAELAELKRENDIFLTFHDAGFKLMPSGIELESGMVRINVAKKGTEFSVSTFNAIVSVHGTVFTVAVKKSESTEVKVDRGVVVVVNIAGEKSTLKAGESSLVTRDGKMEKIAPGSKQQPETIINDSQILEGTASAQQMLNE